MGYVIAIKEKNHKLYLQCIDPEYSGGMYGEDEVRNYRATVEGITAETVQETLRQLVASGNVLEVVMFPAEAE